MIIIFKIVYIPGHLVAQLVKSLTLAFCSGHELTVGEFKPHIQLTCCLSVYSPLQILRLPHSLPLPRLCSLLKNK